MIRLKRSVVEVRLRVHRRVKLQFVQAARRAGVSPGRLIAWMVRDAVAYSCLRHKSKAARLVLSADLVRDLDRVALQRGVRRRDLIEQSLRLAIARDLVDLDQRIAAKNQRYYGEFGFTSWDR